MYSIDDKVLQAYAAESREIYVKAIFNNDVIVAGDKIKSFTVTDSVGNTDGLTLGNACSKKLELDMFVPDDFTSIAKAKIEIQVGISVDGTVEYTPLGIFYVDDYKTTNDYKSVKITAFDAMLKIYENLGDTYSCGLSASRVKPVDVIKDICTQAGVSVSIGNATENGCTVYSPTAEGVLYMTSGKKYESLCSIGINDLIAIPDNTDSINIKLFGMDNTDLTWSSFRAVFFKDEQGNSMYTSSDYYSLVFSDTYDYKDDGTIVSCIEGTISAPSSYDGTLYLGLCVNTNTFESVPDGLSFEISVNYTITNYVNEKLYIYNPEKVEISARDMLGYMAGILGCNAVINREGVLTVRKLEITPNSIPYKLQFMGGLEKTNESVLPIDYVTTGSTADEDGNGGTISVGSGSYGFNFENPYITSESVAQNILNLYKGLEILPCNVNYRGNPSVDCGDIVSVQDKDLNYYNVLVLNNTVSVSGGLSAKIDCGLKTDVKQDFISIPTSKRIEHKVDNFIAAYQDVIKELVGVKGGYVQQVRDTSNTVRALAITQSNIQVKWDEINGKVVTVNSSDSGTPMWVWSYGGLSFSSNGGATYSVAINMAGQIYAEMMIGKLSKFVELQAELGTIGGWTISGSKIYGGDTAKGEKTAVMQLPPTSEGGRRWVFAAGGSNHNGYADCPFRVDYNGNLYATAADISGKITADSGTIASWIINADSMYADYGSYRAYIQKPKSADTWVFSTQVKTADGYNGTFYVKTNGEAYFARTASFEVGAIFSGGITVVAGTSTDILKVTSSATIQKLYLGYKAVSGIVPIGVNTVGEVVAVSSSARYKENITTELDESLNPERLYDLPVVQYNYKKEYRNKELVAGTQIGFIAEDVHKYYPNACIYNEDGEPESWQGRIILPAVLKLVQEQKQEIDILKEQLNNQDKRISALECLLMNKNM